VFRGWDGGDTRPSVNRLALYRFAVFDAEQDRVDLVVFAASEEDALTCARILLSLTIARLQGLTPEPDDEPDDAAD
jgi:hypothetical protein